MAIIKKIIDLFLYGNFWIALCAMAMVFQSQRIFGLEVSLDALALFVFFATLFLYAVHRIVGIAKLHEFFDIDRYAVIARYKSHIQVYAIIGVIGVAYLFWSLAFRVQLALFIPGLLSLGYVIPFLKGTRKRFRDFNHIKIFLIAIVWAWITVWLVALEYEIKHPLMILTMSIERALFIFAITLPFDIRDLKVDAHNSVMTIPASLGIKKTRWIGLLCLLLMGILVLVNFGLGNYDLQITCGLFLSISSTSLLIHFSTPEKHDYYFSGLIDGTMLAQFLFIELMYLCFL